MALGHAVADVLAPAVSGVTPSVVVGRDTRHSGPMLEAALTAGLCSAGANVITVGVLPTAGVAYLARAAGSVAGVMISASHNPYEDNGIKLFSAAGTKLDDHLEAAIESRLYALPGDTRPTGAAVGATLSYEHPTQDYIDFLKATVRYPASASLRVGLDCANGAASVVAPDLFRQLGIQVCVWHATPNGININQQCGSLHPEFLQQKVLEERLDVGFTLDGDADRLIAIDHTGGILDGDYILAICAPISYEHSSHVPRIVVSTVMANLGLDHALQKQGITLHKTQVGDKYVVQAMRQHGAVLGGEPSGHVIFLNHHTTSDGLLTAVQMLQAMITRGIPLAELAQRLHKFPQVLRNVRLRERHDPLRVPQVQQAVQQAEMVLGSRGRVFVRLSGTERVARVMVEGSEKTVIESLAHQIAQAIAAELGVS